LTAHVSYPSVTILWQLRRGVDMPVSVPDLSRQAARSLTESFPVEGSAMIFNPHNGSAKPAAIALSAVALVSALIEALQQHPPQLALLPFDLGQSHLPDDRPAPSGAPIVAASMVFASVAISSGHVYVAGHAKSPDGQ
jgi:hypothetical protein